MKNESQCDALLQVDKAKDDPVGEPLDVILWGGAFQGFKGEVGREGPCDKVRDGCSNGVDKVEESKEKDDADSQKRLGYLRVLLKRVQHRELCELCNRKKVIRNGRERMKEGKRTSLSSWLRW